MLESFSRGDNPGSEDRKYYDLEGAHMLAGAWADLYVRGVFTYQFFYDTLMMLWENQDYVRCHLIMTFLRMAIDEAPNANTDFIDTEELNEFLVHAREASMWHMDGLI